MKIPVENVGAYITAQNKIRYRVDSTVSTKKRRRSICKLMSKEDKHILNVERMDYLTQIL